MKANANVNQRKLLSLVSWKKLFLIQALRQCVGDGLTTATDIAAEMEISKATASRLAAKAIKEGWLKREGREYVLA
jgi:DNA-binding IclR family transcriptional regulator